MNRDSHGTGQAASESTAPLFSERWRSEKRLGGRAGMDSPAGEERAREPSGNSLAGGIDRVFSCGHPERLASYATRKLRYLEWLTRVPSPGNPNYAHFTGTS